MFKSAARVTLLAFCALAFASQALATSPVIDPVHPILKRLSKNLVTNARNTYSYALQTLNPVYPGTVNVINALNQFTREAQTFERLMHSETVNDAAIQSQVQMLALNSQQVAFAINALGANPWLNNLVLRWNQTVTVLNQIKAFVPTITVDEARAKKFAALHSK